MASFDLEVDRLVVNGELGADELDELLALGRRLLETAGPEAVLAMLGTEPSTSRFIGVIATLAAEASAKSQMLVVRADGKVADVLAWAGMQKVAKLELTGPGEAAN